MRPRSDQKALRLALWEFKEHFQLMPNKLSCRGVDVTSPDYAADPAAPLRGCAAIHRHGQCTAARRMNTTLAQAASPNF